jgi:hypothetical protein
MNTPASDFAETGADLLRLVAALARATKGRFDGEAITVLELAISYTEAATNGFAALANSSNLTPEQRQRSSNLSSAFRGARGGIATHFAPGGTVRSFSDLGVYDPRNPLRDRLGSLLDPGAMDLVTVSTTAQDALDALRRDPLSLVSADTETLLKAMGTIATGVVVSEI